MRPLRGLLDNLKPHFSEEGNLSFFKPVFDATDKFFYTEDIVTKKSPFIRDFLDLKRVMFLVVIALIPCLLFGMFNTGHQAIQAILMQGGKPLDVWQTDLFLALGFSFEAGFLPSFVYGSLFLIPIAIVSYAVGGLWEVVFECVRKEEITESFLVTGMLFTLVLPPTTPLWQVALGVSFGVIFGKMIFGGTGFNIVNPALTGRAFLFFAYPAYLSGDKVWLSVDGVTEATPLAAGASQVEGIWNNGPLFWDSFFGFIPGSMGETSFVACLLGAILLIAARIASWQIMAAVSLGTIAMTLIFNTFGSSSNVLMQMPFWWHMVTGGWAFGTVFMATGPVTAPQAVPGKWVYGFLIGVLVVLVRVVNPSFPEGMMVSILLMNVFAPLIDWSVIRRQVKRRKARYA